jgi:hypothetical protein
MGCKITMTFNWNNQSEYSVIDVNGTIKSWDEIKVTRESGSLTEKI